MLRIRDENINTSDFWDDVWEAEPDGLGIEADRWAAVTAELTSPAKVLDVGGGRGEFLEWLGPEYDRTLLDHSRYAVELALARGRAEAGLVGDCAALPFDDETFDATFCCELLEHVEDPARLILNLRRVTKVGGLVGVTTPHRNAVDDRQHIWSFDEADIRRFFDWAEPQISILSGPTMVVVARA